MAGAEYVPPPDARARGDDVTRQPGTLGALLLVAGLIAGLGLLYLGSRYEPSRITQSQAPITMPAPIPD